MPLVRFVLKDKTVTLNVAKGANLRQALLASGESPYTQLTRRANCGGRGLCATCGVWFDEGETDPAHWHDKLAAQFGYPRLSCQIQVERDMTIRLPNKLIWGSADLKRARLFRRLGKR